MDTTEDTKTCSKCGETTPRSEFNKARRSRDGLQSYCRACSREYGRKHKEARAEYLREYSRKYYDENKEAIAENKRKYYAENKEAIAEYGRKYRADNKAARAEYLREYGRKWRAENKEAIAEYGRKYRADNKEARAEYRRDRYVNDPLFRLSMNCRSRLWNGLKSLGLGKSRPSCEYIGCSWEDLKAHLEAQFVDGMTWENQGEWHVDHIVPLCSATTEEELLKLTHYTNLQPLWAADNLSKGGGH